MTAPRIFRDYAKRYVYLYIGAEGEALYAGSTVSARNRDRQHSTTAHWYSRAVDIAVVGPMEHEDALEFERELIAELEPEFNVRGTMRDPRSLAARGIEVLVP